MPSIDWPGLLYPSVSWFELVLRGSTIYWFIFVIFRGLLRRDVGAIGIADVLVVVLIADAAQDAMTGGYTSVTDGLVLVSTLVFWNVLIDWASYHWPLVEKLLEPAALTLVRNGRLVHRNLRHALITPEELTGKLREKGVERISEVKRAVLENDGAISVIRQQ